VNPFPSIQQPVARLGGLTVINDRFAALIVRFHCDSVKGKYRSNPYFPMTIAAQTDLLIVKMNEWDTGHRMADKARSDMHCIIATLPGTEKPSGKMPGDIGVPPTPYESGQTITHPQRDACGTKQTLRPLLESTSVSKKNRPVLAVTAPQPNVADTRVISKPPSKPRPASSRRMNAMEKRAKIQEAILYHAANPHLTQKQVAVQHGLEPKSLSRQYAKKLKKSLAPSRDKTPKDIADDYLYNEKRQKQR